MRFARRRGGERMLNDPRRDPPLPAREPEPSRDDDAPVTRSGVTHGGAALLRCVGVVHYDSRPMSVVSGEERISTLIAGKYRLDRILGTGGFGTVYAGVHEWTGRPIAAKIMDAAIASTEEFVLRFLREAQVAAKLSHPNVVDVLDMGRDDDGTVYLILEHLTGEDLAKVLKRNKRLSLDQALSHLLPIMDALAEAHAAGVVHRDLKPANIFIAVDKRGRQIPKLLDFGIAKDLTVELNMTKAGQIWGTPHFMSPEQASGLIKVGPESDVWAMGVVLFRTLSGDMPFKADSTPRVLMKITSEPAPKLSSVAPDLPASLCAVIDRALTRNTVERYPDMGAFFAALVGAAKALDIVPPELGELLARRDLGAVQTQINTDASSIEQDFDEPETHESGVVARTRQERPAKERATMPEPAPRASWVAPDRHADPIADLTTKLPNTRSLGNPTTVPDGGALYGIDPTRNDRVEAALPPPRAHTLAMVGLIMLVAAVIGAAGTLAMLLGSSDPEIPPTSAPSVVRAPEPEPAPIAPNVPSAEPRAQASPSTAVQPEVEPQAVAPAPQPAAQPEAPRVEEVPAEQTAPTAEEPAPSAPRPRSRPRAGGRPRSEPRTLRPTPAPSQGGGSSWDPP
jgi:serine/threonine protein kinase